MHELHADVHCTAWMHDLLDLVELNMLVVDPTQRKTSNVLTTNLRSMDGKCQTDERYCLKPVARKAVERRHTGMLAQLNDAARKNVQNALNNLEVHPEDRAPVEELKRLTLRPPAQH